MPRSSGHVSRLHNASNRGSHSACRSCGKEQPTREAPVLPVRGAPSGAETEDTWARLDTIERRSPHHVGKEIAEGIDEGRIYFFDKHLSMFPVDLMYVGTH